MFSVKNFMLNDDVNILSEKGCFQVIEYKKDLSVTPETALFAYFCNEMNIRKRQLVCSLKEDAVVIQAGAMQWLVGDVKATSGIKGVGDLLNKSVRGKLTGESAIKPEYKGTGALILEPTYRHIILLDAEEWGDSIVLSDGLFLACDANLKQETIMRSNISSAVAGNEGMFNLGIKGKGIVCIESPVPENELIEIALNDDVLKIDGDMAIAWSGNLEFTVERSGKSLLGSAVSGEGLVNVYRGTGKVLIAPVDKSMMNRTAETK